VYQSKVFSVDPNNGTVSTNALTTASGSTLNSNDLLKAMWHPNKSTGAASSSEKESYTVNSLGQTLTYTDRNGSVHTLSYDVLGRLTSDAVTTLGSGVNGAVRRQDIAYDTADTLNPAWT
jgi:YD repeat-containing protein